MAEQPRLIATPPESTAAEPADARRAAVGYALAALAAGGGVFLWGLLHGRLLLYGDATAHLMIARRMLDSLTPGPSQWGGVWLPLPHWLIAPWVEVDALWRTGAAGSIVSLAALALATFFVHRIARRCWGRGPAHWAAAAFLLNPNLLYLSAVPMTESVYLAAFLGAIDQIGRYQWAVQERASNARRSLTGAALWALAGTLTRYDGWFCLPFFALAIAAAAGRGEASGAPPGASAAASSASPSRPRSAPQVQCWRRWLGGAQARAVARFSWVAGLGPVFWLIYNRFYFKDWLAFSRGPYSARQIYLNALRHGGQRYPGDHQIAVAALYYLKCTALDCGTPLVLLGLLGLVGWWWQRRRGVRDGERGGQRGAWIALLLLLPLPWYLWAMWSGNVPIFVPMYWPHGYYNLRYGVQLLPAAAAWSGAFVALAAARARRLTAGRASWGGARPSAAAGVAAGLALLVLAAYASMLRGMGPMTYAEALYNSPDRLAMEHDLAHALAARQAGQKVLMFLGTYPGALADDGIGLRQVIQESNYRLWDRALERPQDYVTWVVIQQGTLIDQRINHAALERHFTRVRQFTAPYQAPVAVWVKRTGGRA